MQDIVNEARTRNTPLYPVSTGMNWGLGSRHPVRDDCVLVDLRRLDRIRELARAVRGKFSVDDLQRMLRDETDGLLSITARVRGFARAGAP